MPAPITARLTREVKALLNSDEVTKIFTANAMDIDYRDPKGFAVFIKDEMKRWTDVVRKAHISLETQK